MKVVALHKPLYATTQQLVYENSINGSVFQINNQDFVEQTVYVQTVFKSLWMFWRSKRKG